MSRRSQMFDRKLKELLWNYQHEFYYIGTYITHKGVRADIMNVLDLMGIQYKPLYEGLRLLPS